MLHTKTFRNIVFTIVLLVLTAVGIRWNKGISSTHSPVAIGSSVLAEGQTTKEDDFPLELELSRSTLKLGQVQVVTIKTAQFADLEVVTVYPDGKYDREQTFDARADEVGSYRFKFQPNSFRYLGTFRLIVKARLVDKVAYAEKVFIQEPWSQDKEDKFVYPLLP